MNVVPGSASCGRDGFVEGREVACFPARRSAARKNGTSLARREMKRMTPWSEPEWARLLLGANREEIRPDREIVFVVLGILALPLPLLLPLLRKPPPASPRGRIHPTPNSIRSSCASAPASSSCVAALGYVRSNACKRNRTTHRRSVRFIFPWCMPLFPSARPGTSTGKGSLAAKMNQGRRSGEREASRGRRQHWEGWIWTKPSDDQIPPTNKKRP